MKLNIFSKDKTMRRREVILSVAVVVCAVSGIALMKIRPTFGIISNTITVPTGALLLAFSLMFLPCIIFRFTYNLDENKKEKQQNS